VALLMPPKLAGKGLATTRAPVWIVELNVGQEMMGANGGDSHHILKGHRIRNRIVDSRASADAGLFVIRQSVRKSQARRKIRPPCFRWRPPGSPDRDDSRRTAARQAHSGISATASRARSSRPAPGCPGTGNQGSPTESMLTVSLRLARQLSCTNALHLMPVNLNTATGLDELRNLAQHVVREVIA